MVTITDKEMLNILAQIKAEPKAMEGKQYIARDLDGEWYAYPERPVYNAGRLRHSYLSSVFMTSAHYLDVGTEGEPLCIDIFSGEVHLPEQQDSSS